jgi:hypothetical protein
VVGGLRLRSVFAGQGWGGRREMRIGEGVMEWRVGLEDGGVERGIEGLKRLRGRGLGRVLLPFVLGHSFCDVGM